MQVTDVSYQLHGSGPSAADYKPSDRDEPAGGPKYYGLVHESGRFLILKETITSDITTTRYYFGNTAYTTSWTARASLDYVYWYAIKDAL